MGGRPVGIRNDKNFPTPDECIRLTLNVYALTSRRTRNAEALHCRVWNYRDGNITTQPVTDIAGVRKRWERT